MDVESAAAPPGNDSDAVLSTAPPILVVEDDIPEALLIGRVLARASLRNPLISLTDGWEAIAYLGGDGRYSDRAAYPLPALVLLDVAVPGPSGLEILSWLREQPSLKHLPVIMLSGSTESEIIDRAFALHADSYLVKPVAFDALVDAVYSLGLPWMLLGLLPNDA